MCWQLRQRIADQPQQQNTLRASLKLIQSINYDESATVAVRLCQWRADEDIKKLDDIRGSIADNRSDLLTSLKESPLDRLQLLSQLISQVKDGRSRIIASSVVVATKKPAAAVK